MPSFSNTTSRPFPKRLYTLSEVALAGLLLLMLGVALPTLLESAVNWWLAAGLYVLMGTLVVSFWPYGPLGWANRVTLGRGVLVTIVAGALAASAFTNAIWLWLAVAVIALLLDGVDGWIARHTKTHTPFGARFDMELDALLILLLCIGLLQSEHLGVWVLLIGGMRYLFVAASWPFPWLKAPLFDSFRRKAVCVWQVVALLLALTPLTSPLAASLLALSALATLIYSFGFDVWWLHRQHKR
ncbi:MULTISPECIES: CDP-alcohol phosphatidyltransferase family protein [Vreelandella]|uniref:CDP-alcohol phosphatidyltransferase family protein n=2 Tax=Vreelandella TaxID=3137766 RepID=A0A7C9K7H8_9GAMM|nr:MULTISPECIES: CDP-alcohol phosphatidyltransferase family protein [Halomonas]NDL71581.1 CDP-alcohol phosphatidyltransferase family protein [Halomonas alkaliphila]NYS44899.1 CDP-alcohol phosphatidyltransferase family protein [Halomonas zhaodongensis]